MVGKIVKYWIEILGEVVNLFWLKELRRVFKNIIDFYLCVVVLKYYIYRNMMDWLGDFYEFFYILVDWVRL